MICNVDYRDAIKRHNETGADITLIYKYSDNCIEDFQYSNTLSIDGDGRVTGYDTNMGKRSQGNIFMNMFIMKKALFLDIVHNCVSRGDCDFFKDAVLRNLGNFRVYSYEFRGYLANINTTSNYYKTSMQLLDQNISKDLFFANGLIYTKVKDEPPTKYEANSRVTNSLVANGCIIDGQVENSIIFRGVKIKKGAVVKNSIVMQNCLVEEDTFLRNVILDKGVRITREKQLKGDESHPTVIEKKAII
jgi:glucose-1-phosphate adenylyltransferase